ncbi:polygalacturonase [Mucilaginibacter yixingensis]|uniref:Polygalacturonase n=1 Tax=Mucilaginibacter yixingensis TaxID=1295612 RepID=A0A2T5JAG5_9SPHI|nr:glycoside hydrolase family 28 protein [Mucilaginibacter yixingensis]PTQ96999.1 polygalacturonase [Mucilaginibacter yixingensis]
MNLKTTAKAALSIAFGAMSLCATAQQQYSWTNLPKIAQPVFKKDTISIVKFGAKSDGITLNTKAINNAIDACSAKGGGVVLVPQGYWLTGPIVLKSNVNLHVDRAAMLAFTSDKSQYPLVEGNYEGHPSPRNQSPISATNQVNIAVTGTGIIDGHGEVWRAIGKDRLTENEWKALVAKGGIVSNDGRSWLPSESYQKGATTPNSTYIQPGKSLKDYEPMKDFFRPNMVVLTNCKKVLLEGVTVQNSPAWCLHPLLCEDLTLRNVRVRNPWNAQNGDAIDVESCKNVLIEGSTFDAGDDGICVKSGRDEEGRKRGKPTENMIVRNNVVYRAHGGFVIGSEMSGGARNIFVSNCTFIGTDIGLRFKTTRGRGGVVEKIFIKDIAMRDILGSAILFDMYYGGKSFADGDAAGKTNVSAIPVTEATPQFRDFWVSNITCDGASNGLLIRGLPEMAIKDIHLDNVTLKTTKGAEISEAKNIFLKNVRFECKTSPVVIVDNSSNVNIDGMKYTENADQLFLVNGERSGQINVTNTDASKAKEKVSFKGGANSKAISIK